MRESVCELRKSRLLEVRVLLGGKSGEPEWGCFDPEDDIMNTRSERERERERLTDCIYIDWDCRALEPM